VNEVLLLWASCDSSYAREPKAYWGTYLAFVAGEVRLLFHTLLSEVGINIGQELTENLGDDGFEEVTVGLSPLLLLVPP
jgi:hypothetical protein